MNDAEYLFKTTSAERKRNGVGDFHKKRGGGRYVRLPSDNLSKKEREAMNSDVTKINLNAPVIWREFKLWPQDLQVEYIRKLETNYNARTAVIAEMMGIGEWTLQQHRKHIGCPAKVGGKRAVFDVAGWMNFLGKNIELPPEVLVESSPAVEEKVEPPEEKEEKQEPVKIDHSSIMNIAILLDALKGSGAKLTIEVVL